MISTWPKDLPQVVLSDGYNEGIGDARGQTEMDSGPPHLRLRYSSVVRPISAQIIATADDWQRLRRFWAEDTRKGTLPFVIPNQAIDGFNLQIEAGINLCDDKGIPILIEDWWFVLFGKEPPEKTPYDMYFRVRFSLSVIAL
jgi:hypothetical protein